MGTLTHYWVETGDVRGDFPRPLTEAHDKDIRTLEKKIFLSGIDRERYWPSGTGRHEVTFAYSPFTHELVMYRGKRGAADAWKKGKRWHPLRWETGTIDWLGKRRGRWHVDDLKTGAWEVDCEKSKQLRSYAVVPWLLDGAPFEWECDVSITQWPKYPLNALPKRTWHVLTGFDVMDHLAELAWTLSHTNVVNPVMYGPPQKDETGRYNFDDKLPHCAGCESREPAPGISEWITNFWFRSFPCCWEGMKKLING